MIAPFPIVIPRGGEGVVGREMDAPTRFIGFARNDDEVLGMEVGGEHGGRFITTQRSAGTWVDHCSHRKRLV
jgi:hypothetical protein